MTRKCEYICLSDKNFFLDAAGKSTLAVAYDIDYMNELFKSNGFEIERMDKGLWCQRNIPWGGYQDLVVARLT